MSQSKRESVQNEIEDFLLENSSTFNAPYGVLTGQHGNYRSVTFGISRVMDAEVRIYTDKYISLRVKGAYNELDIVYNSSEELISNIRRVILKEEV